MTDKQIAAFAREYAEEKAQSDREQGFPESFIKDMAEFNEKEMKSVLEFLLLRYALVEKDEIKAKYKRVEELLNAGIKENNMLVAAPMSTYLHVLRLTFPEIAKEVEG